MRIHGRSDTVPGLLQSSENGSPYNACEFAPGVSKAPTPYPSPKRPTAALPKETGEALLSSLCLRLMGGLSGLSPRQQGGD